MLKGLISGNTLQNFRQGLDNLALAMNPGKKRRLRIEANLQELEQRVWKLAVQRRKRINIISCAGTWGQIRKEAYLEGEPQVCGIGRSKDAAVGDLMRRWGHKFGVEVRDLC